MIRRYLILLMFVIPVGSIAPAAEVVGEILRVGYPSVGGPTEGRDVVRPGAWVPVVVRLQVEGQAAFDGWIRISQPDKDGDLGFDMQKVQLLPEAGPRTYTLYVVAGRQTGQRNSFLVEVLDGEERRVEVRSQGEATKLMATRDTVESLVAEQFLILSVSDRTAGAVVYVQSTDVSDQFEKALRVAHVSPDDLPTHWLGLDVVDAVVWDEADPTKMSAPQLQALIEWTRQGGLLVVAAGRTKDVIAQTDALRSVLPVTLGPVKPTLGMRRFRRNLLGLSDEDGPEFVAPVAVSRCAPRAGTTAVMVEKDAVDGSDITLITRGRLGRGRVVFVAASLHELFGEGGKPERFFKRVLELRSPIVTQGFGDRVDLFGQVDHRVGFAQAGALYLGSAIVFAVVYIGMATAGSWQFLKKRRWLKHSWSTFAMVAAATSVLSAIAVQGVRGGVGKKLSQLTIVDAEAGSSDAYATAYFGLKTSMFGVLDVWAPDDYPQVTEPSLSNGCLKPLAPLLSSEGRSYADPGRYRLEPSRAELVDVPIRGTVKQFESRWAGSMAGRLETSLILENRGRYDLRVLPESKIENQLGIDFDDSFLIYTSQDLFLPNGAGENADRADKTYVINIGALEDGGVFRSDGTVYSVPEWYNQDNNTLRGNLNECGRSFRLVDFSMSRGAMANLDTHEVALVLVSMMSEYTPPEVNFPKTFTIDGFRHLDISTMIDSQTALFIGFTKAPGPVQLCSTSGGDYTAVVPSDSLTMYRILVPVDQVMERPMPKDDDEL